MTQEPIKYPDYATHQPVLAAMLACTRGPVLELGCGQGSTPLVHAVCQAQGRRVLTCETAAAWFRPFAERYTADWHRWELVGPADYEDRAWESEDHWGLVFVDHGDRLRRGASLERFAGVGYPVVVLVHDTYPGGRDHYALTPERLAQWPHVWGYGKLWPGTTVCSNWEVPRCDS